MSYCVNCGVELGSGAKSCPLCGTPVINPTAPPESESASYFPTRQEEVAPVSRHEAALLISSMLASVAVCCGILNIFFKNEFWWSFFIAGAAFMLWVWFVPPLLWRGMHALPRLVLDVVAVGLYVLLIALALDGLDWYLHLALPLIACAAVIAPLFIWLIRYRRFSILVTAVMSLLCIGAYSFLAELFIDLFARAEWLPSWSLIVLAACIGLSIPLIVVRRVPALREEARRRFHM